MQKYKLSAIIALTVIVFSAWMVLNTDKSLSDSDIRDQGTGRHTVSQVSEHPSTTGANNSSGTKNASTASVQGKEMVKTQTTKTDDANDRAQLVAATKKLPAKQAKGPNARPAKIDPRALRRFGKGAQFAIGDLPDGKLKTQLLALHAQPRAKAMKWLHSFTFNGVDAIDSLRADKRGGIFYDCLGTACNGCGDASHKTHSSTAAEPLVDSGDEVIEEGFTTTVPQTAAAPVSISSPPAYSSKPDSLNHIYLDFNGGNVPGTTSWGGPAAGWDCYPYSLDTNYDEFSDDEQAAIKSIYQRVAEDYAPFDVNVTTDKQYDPDIYTGNKNQVGWVMITTNQDENGEDTPAQSGGRAYLGVFGESNYASSYQPAWITYNSLSGGNESVVAEAASHEMGHNMGLSHDGDSSDIYYEGHGSVTDVADSWGPIMGNSYGENVTQWSKGEYYDSKYHDWNENSYDVIANTQDDLAVISSRVPYRTDDHLAITGGATALVSLAGTISSTTPATDPTNASPENKGIIEMNTDVDVFTFFTGAGNINLSVDPWKVPGKTGNGNISYGGNLDVLIELRDLAGTLIASSVNTPGITGEMTNASISATVGQGNYFLHVKNSNSNVTVWPMTSSKLTTRD